MAEPTDVCKRSFENRTVKNKNAFVNTSPGSQIWQTDLRSIKQNTELELDLHVVSSGIAGTL